MLSTVAFQPSFPSPRRDGARSIKVKTLYAFRKGLSLFNFKGSKRLLKLRATHVCTILIAVGTIASARAPEPSFPANIELTSTKSTLTKLGEYRYVYRLLFKLYDVALYAHPEASYEEVLDANTTYQLQFRYLREIDKSIILESADKILRRNLSPAEFSQISDRVDQINEAYRTVLDGDRSSLTYQPGVGSTLAINGSPAVTIEGADFARLYFKIWLGEQPISSSLRASVLGFTE